MKKGSILPVERSVLLGPGWRWCPPARIQHTLVRGLAFGVYFMLLVGIPFLLILAAALSGDKHAIAGNPYCILKGFYAVGVCLVVFPGMYLSAIVVDTFKLGELPASVAFAPLGAMADAPAVGYAAPLVITSHQL